MSIAPAPHPDQPTQLVTILSGRWYRVCGITAHQRADIENMLTMRNGRRAQQLRYSARPDEDEPEFVHGYADPGGGDLLVAPGAVGHVELLLRDLGADVAILDERPQPAPRPRLEYRGEKRSYQDKFVTEMLAEPNGMGVGPCGSGKTDTLIDLMIRRGQRWLITVRQTDLVSQWAERIKARTNGTVTIYKPQNVRKWDPEADFMVATAQALIRHPDHCFRIDEEREGLCVDECDEVPANEMVALMKLFAPRWRIGATATPLRADGMTPLMYWWIGPCLAKIPREVVEEEGHLLRPRLEVLETRFSAETRVDLTGTPKEIRKAQRKNEDEIDDHIHEDESRVGDICQRVCELAQAGRRVLIPVDSIAYGYRLREALLTAIDGVEFCHAKPAKLRVKKIQKELDRLAIAGITTEAFNISRKMRREMLARVASGATRVLIATSLADRGLDLPIADVTVFATPGGSARRIEQQGGRSCRPAPGKPQPLWVYVLDSGVSRVETVTSAETGARETLVKRPLIARFRRNFYNVFRKMADTDEVAVRRILKGETRDQPSSEPVRAA